MNDLSEYFDRTEFACKCGCGFDTVDSELIDVLHDLRMAVWCSIIIISGCRCPSYNATIDGSSLNSQHTLGRAADIVVTDWTPAEVQEKLLRDYPHQYGIGSYGSFTHIDTRTGKARW